MDWEELEMQGGMPFHQGDDTESTPRSARDSSKSKATGFHWIDDHLSVNIEGDKESNKAAMPDRTLGKGIRKNEMTRTESKIHNIVRSFYMNTIAFTLFNRLLLHHLMRPF